MKLITKFALFAVVVCVLGRNYERVSDGFKEISREKRQTTGPLDCGGNYTAPTGYFHTPGFPVDYLDGTTCRWHIQVPPPYVKIRLDFVPSLSLHSELGADGLTYCYDYVKVHDGDSADAPYDLWCGHGIATPTISSGNSLYLEFNSDWLETAHRGFIAVYTGLTADNTTECVDLSKMED